MLEVCVWLAQCVGGACVGGVCVCVWQSVCVGVFWMCVYLAMWGGACGLDLLLNSTTPTQSPKLRTSRSWPWMRRAMRPRVSGP